MSMGKEEEAARRLSTLAPYQINETLLAQAARVGSGMVLLGPASP